MKRLTPILIALGAIILILIGAAGFQLIKKYTPTKELSDLNAIYGTESGGVALLYNYELQDVKGIYENNQSYLPLSWINRHLNKRFYWDSKEHLLVYALPDQIVYADSATRGSNGAPLILVKGSEVYLPLGLIANYTDIQIAAYDADTVKRVYINDWGRRNIARIKSDGKVRELGGIKSPIVTAVSRDTEVTVLESMEKWSRVQTPDGHIGYIQNKIIAEVQPQDFYGNFRAPEYRSNSRADKIVLAWHQVTSQEGNQTLEHMLEGTKGVNVVSPTWFSLTDNDGNYKSLASKEYVEKAHAMGLEVWALLDNFSKDVKSEELLSSTTTRRKLIASLIDDAKEYRLDGLNMDFESLKEAAGVHYVQFLRELSIPCRENGIVLSVDNYVPAAYNDFYDREEQGIVADYVIIMGYDEHTAGDEAGSVASYEFVKGGIERTLVQVPKEKVINAVPFYTRIWTEKDGSVTSRAVGIAAARKWLEENHVELYWQQELCQYYGECESEEGMQYIWMEEEDSLKHKMDLIKKYDLAGVACWKMGLEDTAAWDSIRWD